jgi:hypothetical protein
MYVIYSNYPSISTPGTGERCSELQMYARVVARHSLGAFALGWRQD